MNDEPATVRIDLDKKAEAELSPDDKLVLGYLSMEEKGEFEQLPEEEQAAAVNRLRRR